MNEQLSHDVKSLEKELDRLKKDNDRLSIKVETYEDMIRHYNLKITDNDEKIDSIKYLLEML